MLVLRRSPGSFQVSSPLRRPRMREPYLRLTSSRSYGLQPAMASILRAMASNLPLYALKRGETILHMSQVWSDSAPLDRNSLNSGGWMKQKPAICLCRRVQPFGRTDPGGVRGESSVYMYIRRSSEELGELPHLGTFQDQLFAIEFSKMD